MAKRRKLSPREETDVLVRSVRRCCLCFGLHGDPKQKDGQIAHLDDNPANNDPDNLAWLCIYHHAQCHTRGNMTKGLTPGEVKAYRERLYQAVDSGLVGRRAARPETKEQPPVFATVTGQHNTVINAAGNVNFTAGGGTKAAAVLPPADAIASNIEMRSYLEYLVGRYIEWRNNGIKRGLDRRRFFPGIMDTLIKSEFGARRNLVPQDRFPDVVAFVQRAIDNTICGKNSRGRNYHTFEEHGAKLRGQA